MEQKDNLIEKHPDDFKDLYDRFVKKINDYLLRMSGDPLLAEELTQETFYRAFTNLRSLKGDKVGAWLFRIAHNLYIDEYRHRNRFVGDEPLEFMPSSGSIEVPEKYLESVETQKKVQGVLQLLPENYRSILLLRDHLGLSYEDIAETIGKSVSTVKVTLFRARAKFRELFTALDHKGGDRIEREV